MIFRAGSTGTEVKRAFTSYDVKALFISVPVDPALNIIFRAGSTGTEVKRAFTSYDVKALFISVPVDPALNIIHNTL